jgi:hypothetical protein
MLATDEWTDRQNDRHGKQIDTQTDGQTHPLGRQSVLHGEATFT